MRKLTWLVKQLLPLTYRTKYTADGVVHFCIWRMWFGRCFQIHDMQVNG